jgi:hypothetical protein
MPGTRAAMPSRSLDMSGHGSGSAGFIQDETPPSAADQVPADVLS